MEKTRLSYIYAAVAIFFWSTIPTVFKIGLASLGVLPMLAISSVTSAIVLFIIILYEKKLKLLKESSKHEIINSALLGLLNPALYYILLLNAYQRLPAQVAQPLNMIWPIILVFLSIPILRQKIRAKSFVALFISFAGVYVISSQGNLFHPSGASLPGVLLATGSSVFWALYFVLNVKDKRDEAIKLFLSFLAGSVYLIVILLITGSWPDLVPVRGIFSSLYAGLFEMGVTFFFWLKALQLAPTTDKVSNLVYLAPFLSLVFVHFIIKEPVYYTTPAGLLLIISGILVQGRKQSTR